MGNSNDVYTKVLEVVSDSLDIDIDELGEDTEFADLDADSFDMLEMVTALEDFFGFEVEEDALRSFRTIGDVVEAIEEA